MKKKVLTLSMMSVIFWMAFINCQKNKSAENNLNDPHELATILENNTLFTKAFHDMQEFQKEFMSGRFIEGGFTVSGKDFSKKNIRNEQDMAMTLQTMGLKHPFLLSQKIYNMYNLAQKINSQVIHGKISNTVIKDALYILRKKWEKTQRLSGSQSTQLHYLSGPCENRCQSNYREDSNACAIDASWQGFLCLLTVEAPPAFAACLISVSGSALSCESSAQTEKRRCLNQCAQSYIQ